MAHRKAILAVIILSIGPTFSFAQSPSSLTIEAAISEGLVHSPEIQSAQAAKLESEWKRFEALGSGFFPKLSINAHHYFTTQYTFTDINFTGTPTSFPGFYPTNVAAVDLVIPVFDGFSSMRGLDAATLNMAASNAELSYAEFQLRQEIRLAFYKSLAAQQLQAVAEQNVKTLEDHLNQIGMQKRGGVATKYDVLRVEVQLNEARADAIDAQDNLETSRKKLTQLLGLESDERTLTGTLPVPNAEKVKSLKFGQVPKERSDIKALNLHAEATERAKPILGAWLIPSIYLGGEYMLYDKQIFNVTVQDTGNYMNAYNFGVFLKWNLFDGGVSIAQEREAAYRAIKADKVAQSAKLKVPYDFEYWKRRYLSNTDHYISKKMDITRSEESVRLAKIEQRAGTRTSSETLDAELDLFRAKAGVVNALVNAVEAEIQLEIALGREI